MIKINLIEETINYVKEFFEEDFSGHDFYHTLRVYNLAKTINKKEGGNQEIIELSALLHDVDDYKLVGNQQEKFYNAKDFLRKHNYPEEYIKEICHIISQVSFKGNNTITPDSLEGKIVQDADRLDAIGAIGIARTFTFSGNHNIPMHIPGSMPKEEYYGMAKTTINHFYEKLLKLKDLMNTNTAKEIAESRHQYMEKYLEEFYLEWDSIK